VETIAKTLNYIISMFTVLGTANEPIVGWTNLNDLTGCALGFGLGLVRIFHGPSHVNAEIVPVDMLVNLLLVACWDLIGNKYVYFIRLTISILNVKQLYLY
jgi:hypothetical protein